LNFNQIDLSSTGVNGDLFDPALYDLLDSSENEKEGLVFETDVADSTSWTYLETVPPIQSFMKSEEERSQQHHHHLSDVMVNMFNVKMIIRIKIISIVIPNV
jgi:hypothetical protein